MNLLVALLMAFSPRWRRTMGTRGGADGFAASASSTGLNTSLSGFRC